MRKITPGPPQSIKGNKEVQNKYEKPWMKKLTPEQAKLLLIGRASAGDENANDLLYLMFHDPDHPRQDHSQ
ncbi:MAG TPA: hypothetical protein VFA85_16310 [Terriglobales bacterium]|nr:hypothetical protein [Terriglobales bacterium]